MKMQMSMEIYGEKSYRQLMFTNIVLCSFVQSGMV